jgi:hypothetical protein
MSSTQVALISNSDRIRFDFILADRRFGTQKSEEAPSAHFGPQSGGEKEMKRFIVKQ